ncbi:MAG: DUF4272 domain-containing protein [Firmicutes bacterium]|nr:DUF4272 domain-containing protein [Bacillota bacterium]
MRNEEKKLRPPGEEAAAYRALCLGALVLRCEFEKIIQNIIDLTVVKIHEDLIARLNDWMDKEGLILYQSARERELFARPPGSWNWQEVVNASWRTEALGVILWALSVVGSLPPYDTEFSQKDVLKPLNLYGPPGNFLAAADLRPAPEIEKAREVAGLWHWRSRATSLQKQGAVPAGGLTFPEIIKAVAGQLAGKLAIEPVQDDFPAFGKPYAELTGDEYSLVSSIAAERHFALNWLCGYFENWDETPTGT